MQYVRLSREPRGEPRIRRLDAVGTDVHLTTFFSVQQYVRSWLDCWKETQRKHPSGNESKDEFRSYSIRGFASIVRYLTHNK